MIDLRPAAERGHFDMGWLNTYHSFSFGEYFDPAHVHFGALRVLNEDRVQPGQGFGTHPHRDMEILTYVLEGALEHKDSMGNGSVMRPGDVQRMSAGTGVLHSEFNPSPADGVHLLQIWIMPERRGLVPSYEQKNFPADERRGKLRLIASRDARDGSLTIHQDADVYASVLDAGQSLAHKLADGRHAWLQVARGSLSVNGSRISAGDGVGISGESKLDFAAGNEGAEFLLFDLA